VYRYTGSAEVRPWNRPLDAGYPRAITTAFPGLATHAAYRSNIDSALVKPGSNELLIFSGMMYMRYDLATNNQIGQFVTLQDSSPQVFLDCGTVQASLAFADSMWLMCESLVQIMTYTPTVNSLQFLPDYDFIFPDSVQTHIGAAVHDSVTGESVFYNGGYTQMWKARTHIGTAQQMSGLAAGGPTVVDPANPTGTDPNAGGGNTGTTTGTTTPVQPPANSQCSLMCATCDPETPNICTSCRTIPTQPLPGGYCLESNVIAYMGFDSSSDADAAYIKGGTQGLTELAGRYGPGLPAVFGEQANSGLTFNGNQKLEMASLAEKGISWDPNEKLRIEAWFYPDPQSQDSVGNLPRQRFITMKDTNGFPLLSIDFYVEPQCTPPQAANCACIPMRDSRFPQIIHPAECQYGNENAQPYCYVSEACDHPQAVDGYDFQVATGNKILLCGGSECTASGASQGFAVRKQFKLGVKTPNNEFNCFVNAPLTAGEWNNLYFEFGNNVFVTGVGGLRHSRAFNNVDYGTNTAGNTQNTFQIGEWEIGADDGGIIGTLDHLQVRMGESSTTSANTVGGTSSDSGSDGAIAAGVIVPIVILGLIAVLCWYYWDQIQEYMGKDSSKDPPISIQAPIAKNLVEPKTRATGMSFDYSRIERNVEWYYVENEQQVGPFTDAIFMSRIRIQVSEDTLVWNGTTVDNWMRAGDVPELKSKFVATKTPSRPPPSKRSATADTLWNYVGPDGSNIGPITETKLLQLNLGPETYVWNGTTVNDWMYLKDTYLAGLQV